MSLKKFRIAIACVIGFVVILSCCYYFSYHNALNDFNQEAIEENTELITYLKTVSKKEDSTQNEELSVQVDQSTQDVVLPDTLYILENYDIRTNTTTTQTLNPPSKFLGLNRAQLIHLIEQEMENMSFEDHQKGLISYTVVSFSKDKIVLRKSYNSEIIQYQYYLALQNGRIVVYYSDRKTVCQYTGIDATELSEEIQAELSMGKFVKDDVQLYSLLEGYSS